MNALVARTISTLTLAASAFGQAVTSCDTSGPHTLYSQQASVVEHGDIKSPDGTKILTVKRIDDPPDGAEALIKLNLTVGKKRYRATLKGFDSEITWAPDSSAFAVTQTEGGGGIGERVYIFYVTAKGLRKLTVSTPIEEAFGTPTKCEVPVPPNTGFVAWLGGSKRVLIAAEVVPVSICECFGMFALYEVHLPDLRILRRYDQATAKQRFANVLGCELRDAQECSTKRR